MESLFNDLRISFINLYKEFDEHVKLKKGYNIVSNNCEHFSNRCAFGTSDSEQVKSVLNFLFGGNF